ncbi:Ser/Thr protein kinase RdoA (MazF antagonist) [Kitasatospora sp. GP30]|uniref:phosphotransferase enzyme family protein n=1 Tax=Kitasatospora sp. GP30 TaxID=3035084 RepID=UPI000CAF5A3E|nr:phosphotransferase [Kitasatospora sp. GP30]MDH6138492.1 Ser/Thr protein kinase RdoA (MazF antagonist) [Kitasatospora sp. GP30]
MRRKEQLAALLATHHDLPVTQVRPGPLGTETDNYQATDGGRRWFVKVYRDTDLAETDARLEASLLAHRDGSPIAAPRPDRHGHLLTVAGDWVFSVWEWIDATPLTTPYTPADGERIGAMLAQLHRNLAAYPHPERFRATSEPWWQQDTARVVERGHRILAAIDALPEPSEGALLHREQTRQRLADVQVVPALQAGLPRGLATQLVHSDFTRPNLLFNPAGELTAVVDLRGRVLHPAWEVGRIAYDPLTAATSPTWRTYARAVIGAYAEHAPPAARQQLVYTARLTLLYVLQTWYGLADTYLEPTTGGDPADLIRYWHHRHTMSRQLLGLLPELEAELTELLDQPASHPLNDQEGP